MRVNRFAVSAAAVLASAALLLPPPLAAADTSDLEWTEEAIVDTVSVGNVTISPDGSSVAFSRSRWRAPDEPPGSAYSNLWRVAFEGGEPERLTAADGSDSAPRFRPDGSAIAFLSKRGKVAKKARIFLLPTDGGESEPLTDEKSDVKSFAWSPDGRFIAFVAQEPKSEERQQAEKAGRDEIVVDHQLRPRRLWILDVASREVVKLASLGEQSAWGFAWSPDGAALVASVTDRNRTDDSYMFKRIRILPREGEGRDLVPIVGKVGRLAWSRDGQTIAYLAGVDASDPYAGSLFVVPAAGGTPVNLTGIREETLRDLAWQPDGRIVVVSVTGAWTGLSVVDPANGASEALVDPGSVAFTEVDWSVDGRRYAFAGSISNHPTDVFAGSAETSPQRIVESNPQLQALPRGKQETIRYAASDGLEIQGVLIRPVGFEQGTRYPLVVIVHGGPESQVLDGWNNSYSRPGHALAERSYMVFFPNYRGSTGRGVAYSKADHRDLGGREFSDVLDGIDHLAAKGWVDPERVGITGGSYGGYFTALGVTRYSERFAAGVNLFGISNWESFMGQSDIPIENAMVHWDLWCYEHVEVCRAGSPIAHIDKARTPTLILQGEKDLRVPKPQSDELYAALRWKQVPVEYVVYPRERHGFRERWHRIDTTQRLLDWMDRHLRSQDP